MSKTLTKQTLFGVPSLETARRVDDSDKVAALEAAHYRLTSRMRELEQRFDEEASKLRSAFLAEVLQIHGSE